MTTRRVLVVAADVLPLPGFPTTGAGLRSWALGKGLEARGHEVVFSMPQVFVNQGREVSRDIAAYAWTPESIDSVVVRVNPDAVVFCHWPAMCIRQKLDIPTVLDFHGPHMLERAFQGYGGLETNVREKLTAIAKADFFTCAGEKQKDYFLGWLLMSGVNLTQDVIVSIPVSMPPELPTHEYGNKEPVFVYGGVFLPWQDPSVGLRLTIETMEHMGRGTLKFFGGKHPGYHVGKTEAFERLVNQLARSPWVEMQGMIPHDELIQVYRRADVALDLMGYNYERELAFTTRTVEYLWCGLPVIYHDYAELSGLIREYQAGWVVNPANEAQVREAIEEALSCPEEVRRRSENAQRLVREHLAWDKTIEPLDAFCRNPWQREPSAGFGFLISDSGWQMAQSALHNLQPEMGKDLPTLAREALYHLRYGGVRTLAYYALGFLQKKLCADRRET